MARVLAPNGRLVIGDACADLATARFADRLLRWFEPGHVRLYRSTELGSLLPRAGLSQVMFRRVSGGRLGDRARDRGGSEEVASQTAPVIIAVGSRSVVRGSLHDPTDEPGQKNPSVTLLWGEDEFLLRERALELLGDRKPTEVDAAEWRGNELQDLATPSLFGEPRALLIADAKSLPKEALAELAAYPTSPDPDAPLVICAQVGDRAKVPAALDKLVKPVGQVLEVKIARKDLEPWLMQRAKRDGLEVTPPAVHALVEILGEAPGQLVAALRQLGCGVTGTRVTPQIVAQQFRGLGEQKGVGPARPGVRRGSPGRDPLVAFAGGGSRRRADGARRHREQAPGPDEGAGVARPDAPGRAGARGRAPLRLASSALSAAGQELLDGAAHQPARTPGRGGPRHEVGRERGRSDAHVGHGHRRGGVNQAPRRPLDREATKT